jgi:hypothetical protein
MPILKEIPLIAGRSNQTADVTIGGIPFTIRMLWNEWGGYWSLSFSELNGPDILTNVKCVANYPLTGAFQRLGLAGDLYLLHINGATYRPTFDDIGTNTYGLYYYDPETAGTNPQPIPPIGTVYSIWDDGATEWDGGETVWF